MKLFEQSLLPDVGDIVFLPLLHNCDVYTFKQILTSGFLEATHCNVFEENLLYTYYGTPSYRLSFKNSTSNLNNFMVCFIIDGEKVDGLYKMFPFDSGAFMRFPEFRKLFFKEDKNIDDFLLTPELDNAKKIVKSFYNSNKNYVDENLDLTISIKEDQEDLINYKNMIEYKEDCMFDSRKSTIELIFNTKIELLAGIIKQIILPKNFLDDPEIINIIQQKMGIDVPLTYRACTGNPNEFFGIIREKYLEFVNL